MNIDNSKKKRIRKNILDLKNNYPEEFGRFIMALDSMIKSDDWERICGIHGLSFNPFDNKVLCPTNSFIVSQLTGIGEPQYCPHGVKHFLIWHTVYLIEFELLLNRYNQSKLSNEYISLPWLNIASIGTDIDGNYDFMSDNYITIQFDLKNITIPNPLVAGKIYLDFTVQKTKRNGYLKTKTSSQKNRMDITQMQFDNSLLITNYESLSSTDIPRKRTTITNTISLETPHNTLHVTVGGSGGSMSSVSTAAHDPIFWLHHCNIDRYFYNWMLRITKNFSIKLTEREILPETLNLNLVPFFSNQIDLLTSDNYTNYKFCFSNNTKTFLKIGDSIDLSQYNYEYETIILEQKLQWKPHYVELIGIPIPKESYDINFYIIPKQNDNFCNMSTQEKDKYLAGSACWIGINRNEIHCDRCEKTRTNVLIDITHYLLKNSINKKNIYKYNLVFEANGLGIENPDGTFNKYTHKEILADGKYILIMDSDDILSTREFKFESKYIHSKLIQAIIHKLNIIGYIINDITNWDEIIKVANKFESDWNMNFSDLIKLKLTDKLNIKSTNIQSEDHIHLLKNLFIEHSNIKKKLEINYITNGFSSIYKDKIDTCINEWIQEFKNQSIDVIFIWTDIIDKNKICIEFNFTPIDGEYGTGGDTCIVNNNLIKIDIDSEEYFVEINGLFELIVKHELGHAFGLLHSSNPKSIMYPFICNLDKKVSQLDILNILQK